MKSQKRLLNQGVPYILSIIMVASYIVGEAGVNLLIQN